MEVVSTLPSVVNHVINTSAVLDDLQAAGHYSRREMQRL
jgi:hypothetical protein